MKRIWLQCALLAFSAGLAAGQGLPPEDRLTARELFFVPAAKTIAANRPTAASKTRPVPKDVVAKIEKQKPAPTEMAKTESASQVLRAGYVPADLKPLGLRYTIIKRVGSSAQEVPVDTEFRSGDRIQVAVEANESGYLYIIARGSSGAWRPLFPSPEVAGGKNFIQAGQVATVPSGYVFTFDEQAGEEKLFLVFSRQPEPSLEKLIYDLGTAQQAKPKPNQVDDKKPADPAEPKTLLAVNRVSISDDVVGNMRRAYARDLIVEKVHGSPESSSNYGAPRPLSASYEPTMEVASYVVNPSNAKDARVVADLSLIHR